MGQQCDAIWGGVGVDERHGARRRKRSQAPTAPEASNCSGDPRGPDSDFPTSSSRRTRQEVEAYEGQH